MYFDFEDYRPEVNPVGRAISLREGVLLSIIAHLGLVIVLLLFWQQLAKDEASRKRQAILMAEAHPPEHTTFVYIPNNNAAPKAPEMAPPSDLNRVARDQARAPKPDSLPFSRGNSPDPINQPPKETARGRGAEPQAGPPLTQPQDTFPEPQVVQKESPSGLSLPTPTPQTQAGNYGRSSLPQGNLGSALNNLQRYTQSQTFRNLTGGVGKDSTGEIQFDSKGVEFGPWLRRFVERVRGNWNVPMAAMSLKGHVVIQFNIHKDGRITDLAIVGPCPIDSFNTAAYGALVASSPTDPLPPEYPDEHAFFTVTFYYNEQVP
ncbi:MAG TPA: TonB C-terminal domain-containing protein [Vicinamibacterales bacterium]|jgi:TonB family protein|nr:TonB C-terminal domain-containing protein [Vicinamibacterales bacterium]